MAAITLPFFTVLWVALATAAGLGLLVLFVRTLRSSEPDVDQVSKSAK